MNLQVSDAVIVLKFECCVVILIVEWRTGKYGIEIERIAKAATRYHSTDGHAAS